MPGLWIALLVIILALGDRSQAQTPAAADSVNAVPVPVAVAADTLGQVAVPALGDSLQLPATVADSLSLGAAEPLAPPALVPVPVTPSPATSSSLPTATYLPKRNRFIAQRRGFLTTRTLWAVGCMGGSLLLYNRGSDYRDKADELYARYKRETDPTQIGSLYQRTTNQDTKGQVCWALSAGLAINGLRLFFTRETEVVSAQATRPSLQMILAPQSLQLRVRKWL